MLTVKVTEELLKIHIPLVHKIVTARLYGNQAHCFRVVGSSFCEIDKRWYRATQIKQSMHFYTAFIMVETGPWAKLKTQFYRTTVKGKDNSIDISLDGSF